MKVKELIEKGYIGKTDQKSLADALPDKINGEQLTLTKGFAMRHDTLGYGDFIKIERSHLDSWDTVAAALLINLQEQGFIRFTNDTSCPVAINQLGFGKFEEPKKRVTFEITEKQLERIKELKIEPLNEPKPF